MNNPPLILIVDDDWMNRELLQAHMDGYEVVAVNTGIKALELAQKTPPDLVIVDVRMPQMDGYELCARLRDNPATRHVPVLVLSGIESDEAKQRALEVGADDVLSKPFVSFILMARVRSLLRIKALHDELVRRENVLWEVLNRHVDEDTARDIMEDFLETNG